MVSDIIDKHPNIVLENDRNGQTALQVLALKSEVFPSGSRFGFWGRFIYSCKDFSLVYVVRCFALVVVYLSVLF